MFACSLVYLCFGVLAPTGENFTSCHLYVHTFPNTEQNYNYSESISECKFKELDRCCFQRNDKASRKTACR